MLKRSVRKASKTLPLAYLFTIIFSPLASASTVDAKIAREALAACTNELKGRATHYLVWPSESEESVVKGARFDEQHNVVMLTGTKREFIDNVDENDTSGRAKYRGQGQFTVATYQCSYNTGTMATAFSAK